MNRREMFQALCDGKKVRQPSWDREIYIYMTREGEILDEEGCNPCTSENADDSPLEYDYFVFEHNSDWELYGEENFNKIKPIRFFQYKKGTSLNECVEFSNKLNETIERMNEVIYFLNKE